MYKRISSVVFFDISTFQYRGRPRDRARIGASGHQRGQGQMRHTIKAHRHATSTAAAPSREYCMAELVRTMTQRHRKSEIKCS